VEFSIRDYRPEDFQTLWQIDQSCFPPEIAYSQRELGSYLRRPKAFSLVAETLVSEISPSILGFVVAEPFRGHGHIITIDVRSEARRHRIGSVLLDAAEARFRDTQCPVVHLETAVDNSSALAFYKRHGYDVIKTIPRYYSNGVDALLLEKDLLPTVPRR
jgi:ribosomal-protein-alanine N-acetyltransferase